MVLARLRISGKHILPACAWSHRLAPAMCKRVSHSCWRCVMHLDISPAQAPLQGVVLFLFRPLVLGSRERNGRTEWCVASEDCAFGPIGFHRVRDVAPGEMIVISGTLPLKYRASHQKVALVFQVPCDLLGTPALRMVYMTDRHLRYAYWMYRGFTPQPALESKLPSDHFGTPALCMDSMLLVKGLGAGFRLGQICPISLPWPSWRRDHDMSLA